MSHKNNTRRVQELDARAGIPMCIYWDANTVAEWIVQTGFPQYKACFEENFISGRDLIGIDASTLPLIGIYDFEHIKAITKGLRDLLNLDRPISDMTVAMADPKVAYMEMKRRTGAKTDDTSFPAFVRQNLKWFRGVASLPSGSNSNSGR